MTDVTTLLCFLFFDSLHFYFDYCDFYFGVFFMLLDSDIIMYCADLCLALQHYIT